MTFRFAGDSSSRSLGASPPALSSAQAPHRIVVVGGGAGGLELVTRLGDRFAKDDNIQIVLVDRLPTHLWKPLLHEVAAGSMDPHTNQLEYIAQARWHHFEFQQGELLGLDRERKTIRIAAVHDEDGIEILPERDISYGTLVLSIGSVTNFFGTTGAQEHALAVDSVREAEHFRRRMVAACMRAARAPGNPGRRAEVCIAIIGGGATGVELSAELRNTAQVFSAYGLHHLDPQRDIRITIIEAGPRILGPLPERIAAQTARLLSALNIEIITGDRVTEVKADAVVLSSGKELKADITVWAAGIRIPPVLGAMGLPTNKLGQVIVKQSLQSEIDPDIFAFGDCASCPWPETGKTVPPRAQAAHQQATHLFKSLQRRLKGQELKPFRFRDHGSLISLGRFNAVGNLMGKVIGRSLLIEGTLARFLYFSLYRSHLLALHGFMRTMLDTLAQWLRRKTAPRVKLH
jgi:NADH dehydrogenase